MTDFVVGPGGTLPDVAGSMDAHALRLGQLPLLVLAARFRATQIDRGGHLVAAAGHGLPVVICTAAGPDDVLDVMASGRATWVRTALDVR